MSKLICLVYAWPTYYSGAFKPVKWRHFQCGQAEMEVFGNDDADTHVHFLNRPY